MYGVKPGRGPSLLSGIGGIVAIVFGIIFICVAASMGAPGFFVLFGIIFVVMAIGMVAYSFYNALARNRMSTFDVTRPGEETDPIATALGHSASAQSSPKKHDHTPRQFEGEFCPYCGTKLQDDFDFCPKCGKDI